MYVDLVVELVVVDVVKEILGCMNIFVVVYFDVLYYVELLNVDVELKLCEFLLI